MRSLAQCEYRAGHPHAGGEILFSHSTYFSGFGPSPRGWGNQLGDGLERLLKRAIPTRVGKSARSVSFSAMAAGHPHAGGEILTVECDGWHAYGPSPRGWGNRSCRPCSSQPRRAIPTRVGKSFSALLARSPPPGHPHAGGEISVNQPRRLRRCGPSPRGWGNLASTGHPSPVARAIPTRVGKSVSTSRAANTKSGHPHAGGEIRAAIERLNRHAGPSPRGWGNLALGKRPDQGHRAIPTRVGKSF